MLASVAKTGGDYGDALEFARKKAELLHAAQQAGKQITPELAAEIDRLAQGYVTAGLNAEEAADKMGRIKEQSERGKDALEDMFGSIIDGSMSAKEAVAQLLIEIAKAQMLKGLMGLPGMGGLTSAIGGLLSFEGGGYTGNGSRTGGLDGKGGRLAMVHPRETIIDHTKGQKARQRTELGTINFSPVINAAPGVTPAELAMTLQVARHEYERDFPKMLQKHMPDYNERYA